ncbi:MAG: PIG-L family deacetylase [Xanthomonadales bacterium]|nr:PIG-L family deacetylase [Xanthomonadales bacterium]
MNAIPLSSQDRVLVFAPHPDDETIAAGVLLQSARAAGAAVRIVFATNGDNNPWPQRWLERRWRIDQAARERWGLRRQGEARAALGALGLDEPTTARFLGWPDQGLTARLMDDAAAIDVLRAELDAFGPSHVVLPTLADSHPDHSALRIMVELALLGNPRHVVRLGYTIHGDDGDVRMLASPADAAMCERKLRALGEYCSQTTLSERRLFAIAGRAEAFVAGGEAPLPFVSAGALEFGIASPGGLPLGVAHELLIVAASRAGTRRFRIRLPRLLRRGLRLHHGTADGIALQVGQQELLVSMPAPAAPLLALWAKLHRVEPRLVVFDGRHWQDGSALFGTQPAHAASEPAPGWR